MILYRDDYFIVYHKMVGEDSEKLNEPIKGYSIVTRLDKPVEGLLLMASDKGFSKLRDMDVSKEYIAVTAGAITPDRGQMKDYLYHDKRSNKTFPVKKIRNGVKEAILSYEVLAYNPEKDLSYVKIKLETGRTHQIRVQFATRKHPLYGDGKYGSRFKGYPALCCSHIEFLNPITNSPMAFDIMPEGEPWNLFDI